MSNIEKHNSCLLSICDKDDVIIRVVNIDPNDVNLMNLDIITVASQYIFKFFSFIIVLEVVQN